MAEIELTDDLINLQAYSDAAHAAVRESATPEAWATWRDRAAEVQAAITAHALETGQPRNKVEAEVKKRVRHPEPVEA